jgi:hypothetical protein
MRDLAPKSLVVWDFDDKSDAYGASSLDQAKPVEVPHRIGSDFKCKRDPPAVPSPNLPSARPDRTLWRFMSKSRS